MRRSVHGGTRRVPRTRRAAHRRRHRSWCRGFRTRTGRRRGRAPPQLAGRSEPASCPSVISRVWSWVGSLPRRPVNSRSPEISTTRRDGPVRIGATQRLGCEPLCHGDERGPTPSLPASTSTRILPGKHPTGQLTPINPRRDHQGLAERRLGVVNERRCCLIRGHCVTRNPSRSVSRALANGFTS